MTTNLNRRGVLMGGAALSALAIGMPSLAFGQETRLRYYFWGGPGRSDRKVDSTAKFAATQQGLAVDSEWSPWADYWPRLSTQIAGGNPPDLIQMDYRYIIEYAERGVLLPLDEYYPSIIKAEDFGQQRIDSGRVNGKLYGITIGDNALGLGYDADAWAAAGAELTNDLTWDSFKEACAKFKAGNQKAGYYATSNWGGGDTAFEIWLRQRDKALYADGGLGFDEADATEWFTFWKEMSDEGLAPPADVQALAQPNPENNMLTLQQAASAPLWSNEINPIQKLVTARLEMVPLPRQSADGKSGAYLKPSQFMSISAMSKAPERAAEVINYLTTNLQAFTDIGVETAIPPGEAVRKQIAGTLDETAKKSLAYVELIGERADPLPIPPIAGAGEIATAMADTHLAMLFGQLSPEQAAQQLITQSTEIIGRT